MGPDWSKTKTPYYYNFLTLIIGIGKPPIQKLASMNSSQRYKDYSQTEPYKKSTPNPNSIILVNFNQNRTFLCDGLLNNNMVLAAIINS